MASTSSFDQLKVACNSNRLEHCFRFLFMEELAKNESFITVLEAQYEAVRQRMVKHRNLLQEGRSFSCFNPVTVDGLRCTSEGQYKDGLILNTLLVVLELAREAREEKRAYVSVMEQYG